LRPDGQHGWSGLSSVKSHTVARCKRLRPTRNPADRYPRGALVALNTHRLKQRCPNLSDFSGNGSLLENTTYGAWLNRYRARQFDVHHILIYT